MYAIIQSGGKQMKAEAGKVIKIERIAGDQGGRVTLDRVLALNDGEQVHVGTPVVEGAAITGRIVEQGRHPKVIAFKYRRRKDSRKKKGHRQDYTALMVEEIALGGKPIVRAEFAESSEAEVPSIEEVEEDLVQPEAETAEEMEAEAEAESVETGGTEMTAEAEIRTEESEEAKPEEKKE
jgi:large subunit ribosomal protein L21